MNRKGNLNPNNSQPIRLKNLVGLCKVWGLVRKVYPSFLHQDSSFQKWDEACVEAIPKVEQAKSVPRLRTILNELFLTLQDGNTKCLDSRELKRQRSLPIQRNGPKVSWKLQGKVAIIMANDHESFHQPSFRDQHIKSFTRCFQEATNSQCRTILFDLRLIQGNYVNTVGGNCASANPSSPFKVILESAFKTILPKRVRLPAFRQTVSHGLPPSRKTGTNVFQSGMMVSQGGVLHPSGVRTFSNPFFT